MSAGASNLIILDVCIPEKGWVTPRVFAEDNPEEMAEMNQLIQEAKSANYTIATKHIHGMAVGPLRQYLRRVPT